MIKTTKLLILVLVLSIQVMKPLQAAVFDESKQVEILKKFSFWDNKDWLWYRDNIPFIETPDEALDEVYYYRWQLVTKHLRYGSPRQGYVATEFNDTPFYAGAYGAIVAASGLQLWEMQWLREPEYAKDYLKTFLFDAKSKPYQYSSWLAESAMGIYRIHPNNEFLQDVLPELDKYYQQYHESQYDSKLGLYWSVPVWDATEKNIASYRTDETYHGGDGFRATLNSYMYANAAALAEAYDLQGNSQKFQYFNLAAIDIKNQVQNRLWNDERSFFIQRYRLDEASGIKAHDFIDDSGPYVDNKHGRELTGYVPWAFNLPKGDRYQQAFKYLMDPSFFNGNYGFYTAEKQDPLFKITEHCCSWRGNTWPFATSLTLKAMANVIQQDKQSPIHRNDYYQTLQKYVKLHLAGDQNGAGQKPYIAEAANPKTGSWDGHNRAGHSEHYFHSSFVDLVLSGLLGIQTSSADVFSIHPLIPENWDFFAIDNLRYHGHDISVFWDKSGKKYSKGAGFKIFLNGIEKVNLLDIPDDYSIDIPVPKKTLKQKFINYAANVTSIKVSSGESTAQQAVNGKFYYTQTPADHWVSEAIDNINKSWFEIDFITPKPITSTKLYFLEDQKLNIKLPEQISLEYWKDNRWHAMPGTQIQPQLFSNRANIITFPKTRTSKVRIIFSHKGQDQVSLSEIEMWGPKHPLTKILNHDIEKNKAINSDAYGYPRANASFAFVKNPAYLANDGDMTTMWNSLESRDDSNEWLEVDFGGQQRFSQLDLYLHQGTHKTDFGQYQEVSTPLSIKIEFLDMKGKWQVIKEFINKPEELIAGNDATLNRFDFKEIVSERIRILFSKRKKHQIGVNEINVY